METDNSNGNNRLKKLGLIALLVTLGAVCLSTSIAAEFKRNKVDKVVYVHGECTLPQSPAMALGLTAALALLISQISTNVGGCLCCCNPPRAPSEISSRNRSIAVLSLFFSWVTFGFSFLLLVVASSMNQRQPYKKQWLDDRCYVVKPGIFASAGVLSVITVALGLLFYAAATASPSQTSDVSSLQRQNGDIENREAVAVSADVEQK